MTVLIVPEAIAPELRRYIAHKGRTYTTKPFNTQPFTGQRAPGRLRVALLAMTGNRPQADGVKHNSVTLDGVTPHSVNRNRAPRGEPHAPCKQPASLPPMTHANPR